MRPASPLAPFLEPLEALGLPYCITGSVAASEIDRAFIDAEAARLGLSGLWLRCQAQG